MATPRFLVDALRVTGAASLAPPTRLLLTGEGRGLEVGAEPAEPRGGGDGLCRPVVVDAVVPFLIVRTLVTVLGSLAGGVYYAYTS